MRRVFFIVLVVLSITAGVAQAAPSGTKPLPTTTTSTTPTTPTPPTPITSNPPPSSGNGGLLGSPDTTQSLGMTDASCSHDKGASAEVIRNCAASGLAESAYPPSNFGTDTNVDTGPLSFINDLAAGMQTFIGGIFALLAHILTWILEGLGLAFSFDLFAQDTHGQIGHSVGNTLNLFSLPLLPIFFVIGAIVAVVYWGVHKAEGKAVTHIGGMVLLMGLGIIIALNPVGSLGWLDQTSNELTSGTLAAFTGHNTSSTSGFADATPGMYRVMMEEPWCAVEFGNVSWCMAPIDPTMAQARQNVLVHLDQALGDQGTKELAAAEAPQERLRLADAKTNGELFLSFIPNSDARNGKSDNWTLYHALLQDHPELAAIRGPGGVWERFTILFLAGIAGMFALLLLIYIAYQLIVASIFFVVCLCLVPLMIFAPAFGDKGRAVFVKWLSWMAEALFKRVVFAAYLGVILLATVVFLNTTNFGWGLRWFILAIIWAMGFHFRHRFLDLITAGAYNTHPHPWPRAARWVAGASAAYAWKRAPQRVRDVHEHHHHHDEAVNQTHQHLHVYGQPNGGGEGPVRVPSYSGSLEGTAKELEAGDDSET